MFKEPVQQRLQRARIFQGRLAELLFAAWLHHEGWRIEALEALGAVADVVATSPARQSFSFEIKHLGQDEALFELGVKAISGNGVSDGWIPVYSPIDYLLFRVFEAARQLESSPNPRIVVIILADYDVYFRIPLSDGWIDWQNPKFLRRKSDIEDFLRKQYERSPLLDQDIQHYISQIDQIWLYDICGGLMMRRRKIEEVRGR